MVVVVTIGAAGGSIRRVQKPSPVQAPLTHLFNVKEVPLLGRRSDLDADLRVVVSIR